MRPIRVVLACAVAATITAAPRASERPAAAVGPLTIASARVSLEGTSNVHEYTASTEDVRVTAIELAGVPTGDLLEYVLQPGNLKTFDVQIPAASLSSPREGLDKNMHKALKVKEYPDLRFTLRAIERTSQSYRAVGVLTIAGVEREVAIDLRVQRKESTLAVSGTTELMMTDFGIAPPRAMLGMLKTNPKVTIRIEVVLGPSLT